MYSYLIRTYVYQPLSNVEQSTFPDEKRRYCGTLVANLQYLSHLPANYLVCTYIHLMCILLRMPKTWPLFSGSTSGKYVNNVCSAGKRSERFVKRNERSLFGQTTPVRAGWTTDETEELLKGVRQFGPGKWKMIMQHYKFAPHRTTVSLKDKWRNLQGRKT